MNINDKKYKIHIFKKAINNYLDKILPYREQDALNALLNQMDDIVWKIATTMYIESGYKIDFALIRNIATSRIKTLENSIAVQKAEEAKLRAEMKVQNISKIQHKDREKEYFLECIGDINMYKLFLKIKEILVNQLKVDSALISLDTHIINDLGADDLDIAELEIMLKEKFDLKMSNNSLIKGSYFNSDCPSSPISGDVQKLLNYLSQQITFNNKS